MIENRIQRVMYAFGMSFKLTLKPTSPPYTSRLDYIQLKIKVS